MKRIGRLWPAALAAMLVLQITVMAALPEQWLTGEVVALTVVAAIVVTRILLIMMHVGERRPAYDDTVPSPLMATAARMAEAGASAAVIAKRCYLPLALAELVVAEAGRAAGTSGANGSEPMSS